MVNGQLNIVVQHISRLAGKPSSEALSDGQLLEELGGGQQEAAFAVLVRRHGPMVLGVCRRMLGNAHDAEEAFQATFLVFFRRAHSLGRRGSVANWLYTVAYHVALKARAGHARRRRRERQVVEMRQTATQPQEIWTDLQPVLDEELNRLPENYRALVVLCYLEGKTNEQAAKLLGCPAGTVKGRLSRARQMLRSRLLRRGITLSAPLIAILLTEQATAAVPAALATYTTKTILAAVGKAGAAGASAPVTALAEGVLKAMFMTKLKIATAVLLTLGLFGMGVGLPVQFLRAQRAGEAATQVDAPAASSRIVAMAPAAQPAESNEKEKEQVVVAGRVLDATGKPVADAKVAVLSLPLQPLRSLRQGPWVPYRILGESKGDDAGRFRLTMPPMPEDRGGICLLLARGTGCALGWQHIHAGERPAETEFRLQPEHEIRGRLVDLQGQPAAGVRISPTTMQPEPGTAKAPSPMLPRFPNGISELDIWPQSVTTDAEGRFSLHGMAAAWSVTIKVDHERFAPQELNISAEDQKKGAELTQALAPARTIEGDVTCADTGKPVPNARLVIEAQPAEYDLNPHHTAEGKADDQGRFRVSPPVGGFVRITAYPPAGSPYLTVFKGLEWPKANVVKREMHLALPRGILVRGIVTETPSGKPVAGARVDCEPNRDNNAYYRDDIRPNFSELRTTSVSGPDGKFELAILPGPSHLLINGPTLDYIHAEITSRQLYTVRIAPNSRNYPDALLALNLKPQPGPHEVAVTLRRGVTLRGNLVDTDGKPVQKAVMVCRSYIPYGYDLNGKGGKELKDGRFELPGCDPEKPVEVFFLDTKHQLGVCVEIAAGKIDGNPITVQLQRCGTAKARFVSEDGKPVVKLWPVTQLILTPGQPFALSFDSKNPTADVVYLANLDREHHNYPEFVTDADGRATFQGLIPGAKFWTVGDASRGNFRKDFTVRAGETIDLGEIKVTRKN